MSSLFFFFNDTATTEIYTLSLHDALPISVTERGCPDGVDPVAWFLVTTEPIKTRAQIEFIVDAYRTRWVVEEFCTRDRKSTRLNSSHLGISYAVFCLKKKNKS